MHPFESAIQKVRCKSLCKAGPLKSHRDPVVTSDMGLKSRRGLSPSCNTPKETFYDVSTAPVKKGRNLVTANSVNFKTEK